MPADLHIHSTFSDGTNSPEEIIKLAKLAGLTTIALTDHDTIGGIESAAAFGEKNGIRVIPGIEFTTEAKGSEIHILGYLFDIKNKKLLEILSKIQKDRVDRIYKMVEKLNRLGVDLKAEDVFKFVRKGSAGRPHVARALVRSGAVSSVKEAFDRYIDFRGPAYVSHYKLEPAEAVQLINEASGIAVYAHPAVSNRDEMIGNLVPAGLKGLEVFYPGYTPEQVMKYKNIADKNGLLLTGGTDFHGENSGREVKLGNVTIPDEMADKLYEHIRRN